MLFGYNNKFQRTYVAVHAALSLSFVALLIFVWRQVGMGALKSQVLENTSMENVSTKGRIS